jgi:hypothetical protein
MNNLFLLERHLTDRGKAQEHQGSSWEWGEGEGREQRVSIDGARETVSRNRQDEAGHLVEKFGFLVQGMKRITNTSLKSHRSGWWSGSTGRAHA